MAKIKLRIFVVALVATIMAFFSQSTLAFYSTVGTATNVVTSGNIRFIIHEMTDQGTAFPEEGVYIVPGDIVFKKVNIQSDCEHPFYLRVKIIYASIPKSSRQRTASSLILTKQIGSFTTAGITTRALLNPV